MSETTTTEACGGCVPSYIMEETLPYPFCPGCGLELSVRMALKVIGPNAIISVAPSCTAALPWPIGAGRRPWKQRSGTTWA